MIALFSLALACGTETPQASPPPVPPPANAEAPAEAPDPDALAMGRVRAAAQQAGAQLKARLTEAMEQGGPVAAIDVCHLEAGQVTERVAKGSGVRIGRSSLRLRNPENAPPDWVASWLETQGEREAAGVEGIHRIEEVAGPDGQTHRMARFLAPIAIDPPCLVCHGPKAELDATIAARLRATYPEDQATGYGLGALRGALWAELAVP